MKIYTRTGDAGETGLLGGARVSKSHHRVEAYGGVDELNAIVGVAISQISNQEVQTVLEQIQGELFSVGALLAGSRRQDQDSRVSLGSAEIKRMEERIDRFEARLPGLTQFILPGGSPGGAALHQARSVCRRAERGVVTLARIEAIPEAIVPYLNRLSDLLFVLARFENQEQGTFEKTW